MKRKLTDGIIPVGILGFMAVLSATFVLRFQNSSLLYGTAVSPAPDANSFWDLWDGNFQESFDSYLNDNFYGHTMAVKLHNQIEYTLFHNGVENWLVGKEGYVFEKNQTYSYVGGGAVDGRNANDYEQYAQKVYQLQSELQKQGKEFLYLVNPVKAEIYPDKLPWYEILLEKKYANHKDAAKDRMIAAFEKYGVHYYDTTDDLIKMRMDSNFEIFPKTGHHWTLNAVTHEWNRLSRELSKEGAAEKYPYFLIHGVTDKIIDEKDKDALELQNVLVPILSEKYTTPEASYAQKSDQSVYLFGTSYGMEIAMVLNQDPQDMAFQSFVYQCYFTTVYRYSKDGFSVDEYTQENTPQDLGILEKVQNSNLVIMEQPGAMGLLDTHIKFLDYVNEAIGN